MHAIFMPYGKRSEVELLLRDMEAQKHFLKFNEGGGAWIQGQVRVLPFGVYEYVFPKEDSDIVLNTLDFKEDRYTINKLVLTFLRKFIKCDKAPDYKKDRYYRWIKDNVTIVPIGVRHDLDVFDPNVKKTHEAI